MKRDVTILRVLLFLYILFCLILAGLNQGPDKELAKVVAPYWHAYENEGKTLLILICGLLTYRITGRKGRNTMRSKNLRGSSLQPSSCISPCRSPRAIPSFTSLPCRFPGRHCRCRPVMKVRPSTKAICRHSVLGAYGSHFAFSGSTVLSSQSAPCCWGEDCNVPHFVSSTASLLRFLILPFHFFPRKREEKARNRYSY